MKFSKRLLVTIPVMALTATIANPFTAMATAEVLPAITNESLSEENENAFTIFTGKVQEINKNTLGTVIIRAENKEELIDFRIDEKTVYVTADGIKSIDEIAVGDSFTVYYIEPLFSTMIYPPQRTASVIAADTSDKAPVGIYAGKFDENLVSTDNYMKINKSETINIIDSQGKKTDVNIENKYLVVIYGFMTMSIPGQTTPSTIIVLDIEDDGEIAISANNENPSEAEFFSENVKESPEIIVCADEGFVENGHVMLPLRSVLGEKGMTIVWNGETQSIEINSQIKITIGKDSYINGSGLTLSLGQAPMLVKGVTYVPAEFFKEIMNIEVQY